VKRAGQKKTEGPGDRQRIEGRRKTVFGGADARGKTRRGGGGVAVILSQKRTSQREKKVVKGGATNHGRRFERIRRNNNERRRGGRKETAGAVRIEDKGKGKRKQTFRKNQELTKSRGRKAKT